MKILLVSLDYPPLSGGVANLSYKTAKVLSAETELFIVVASAVEGYKEFDKRSNLTTFRVTNVKIFRDIALFFLILYLVFKFRVEVIYNLTWYPPAVIAYFVNIITRTPYVIHVHAADYFEDRRGVFNKIKYSRLRGLVKKLTFDRANRVITVSGFMKDKLIVRGIDALKIETVYPGVDCGRFAPGLDPKEVISRHGLKNKKVLLTVSRLDDYKGSDMVIKALPKIAAKFPDIAYLIIGSGPYEKYLRGLVEELDLNDRVIFAGWVDDDILPLYYNACDIFIMLSREISAEAKVEGYGLVFLEASACGKPIIAGRSGGIGDAVIDGVTGILVDPLNLDEIDDAVTKILSDNHYARALGANGLNRIEREKLDWHSRSKKIGEILAEARR